MVKHPIYSQLLERLRKRMAQGGAALVAMSLASR